jgi:gluconate/galactonate dehydratase
MYFRDRSARTMGIEDARYPPSRDVEITDVQTTVVGGNYQWIFVRVYTDTGVTGTGEAYWGDGVASAINGLSKHIVGENPLDIDRLTSHLIERAAGQGSIAGTIVTAISGIEIALHDLAGKIHAMPAYQLLGGKYRDSVRVYCDTHAGEHPESLGTSELTPEEIYSPEGYVRAAEEVVSEGFDALKFDLDVPSSHVKDRANRYLRHPEVDNMVDIVSAVTESLDDDVDVAFDLHWTWSGDSASRLAKKLEPYDVWWLEDPVPPENIEVHREVTRDTATTMAAGENRYRKHGHRRLIEEQAVDMVHPDLPKIGGMHETRKIADLADSYYMPIGLHNVSSPLGTVAGVHVAASIPNFVALEYHARDVTWWADLVEAPVIEDGYIDVPEAPGLGVTLDMDVVEEHMVEGETLFDEA